MAGYKRREQYRNEWKYYISLWEAELLKERLLPFMEVDPHARDGKYTIRSLYFDDYWDSSYEEKMMGVDNRKKWRIRIYDFRDSSIKLERKKKWNSYIYKESAEITREEFDRLMAGDYGFLLRHREPLCQEFYYECMVNLMRPKVIVDYEREPLIRQEGDVRITFDGDVRAAIAGFDIFTKGDSGSVAVYLENPDAAVLEPVHDAQSLSVVGGEGVEWYLDPAPAGEGFTDAIEVDVCFENGRTLSGRIKIEWADGSLRARFETDG